MNTYEEKAMVKYFGRAFNLDTAAKECFGFIETYFNSDGEENNKNEQFKEIWINDMTQMIVQSAQMDVITYDTAVRQILAVFIIYTHFNTESSENMVAQTKSYLSNEEYENRMNKNVCKLGLETTLKSENIVETNLWWQKNYYLRNTPVFQERATPLEYCIKYGSINDINMLMKEYWHWMNIYMVEAFVENKHIVSSNVYQRNQHPLTNEELNKIVAKSSTNYKGLILQLLPDCSWRARLNMGDVRELKRKCHGPYFKGIESNGNRDMFQRDENVNNKNIKPRARRTRLQYLIYKLVMSKPLEFRDRLVYNPNKRGCCVPSGSVCINPYCYDIISNVNKKRLRPDEFTDDDRQIAQAFMKKYPQFSVIKRK